MVRIAEGVGVQKRNMAQMKRLGLTLAVWVAWAAALSAQSPATEPAPGCASAKAQVAPASRIVGDWHASARVKLPDSQPPVLALAADLGIATPETRLERILLLLEPSPAQKRALDAELDALQTTSSCANHRWLTAAQFADAYANSASDVSAVADWLRSEGFTLTALSAGRGWIEFSGTARQVEQVFGAPVHAVMTPAGTGYALRDAITAPAALEPLIHGLVSLDGSISTGELTTPELVGASAMSSPEGTPNAVAARLSLNAVQDADGSGEQIAIAARSDVNAQDVAAFRRAAGLKAQAMSATPMGADPGLTADQAAATAMASWAGAAAPGAQVVIVPAATTAATDGLDLSLAAIVDGKLADTVVVGYSACEPELSATHQAFYAALYRQAAAEGISVIAASGDSGASACHAAGSEAAVSTGFAANALASTPWNTAVGVAAGGADGGLQAWSTAVPGYSSGGGVSAVYPLPAWQPAMPGTAPGRLLPDVALPTASDGSAHEGLFFCMSGAGTNSGCTTMRGGGSAIAAAIMGGISARLNEKYGAQGNLAPGLYALRSDSEVFDDVQTGTAKLPCAAGTPGCDASGRIGYDAASGYDLATGLGSVNAAKLVSDWASPQAAGTGAVTVNVTVSPAASNQTYNPTAQITFTATVASQTGGSTPTGTVQFFDQTANANLGSAVTLGTNATASLQVTSTWTVGGHNVVAKYSGDTNYAALTSRIVSVNIQQSTTAITVTPSTTTPAVGQSFTATATIAVDTPAAGATLPVGKVSLTVDGVANSTATLATTNGTTSASFTLTLTSGGTHALQATYVGDTNYVTSTSSSVQLTVAKGATTTTLTAAPTTLTAGTPETFTATVAPANTTGGTASTLTGTVTFYDGTTQLGTGTLAANVATLSNVTLSTTTAHQITAVYSGDNNWATSASTPVMLAATLLRDTVTLTATPAAPTPGQLITLAATVAPSVPPTTTGEQNPTGTVTFYQGTTALGSAPLAASLNNTAVASLSTGKLSGGQNQVTAVYSGDQFYAAATSNALSVSVQDFSLAPAPTNPPTNLNIVKGQSGTASFVITALGGFGQQVQVVCTAPTQADVTCSPTPQQVTPTSTVRFTVQTFTTGGPAYGMNRGPMWLRGAGGAAFAGLLLFLVPRRGRRLLHERARRFIVLALMLAGLCGVGLGCQSVSTLPSSEGTPLGVSTLTITATAYVNNVVVSHSVYLTVNVIPPG